MNNPRTLLERTSASGPGVLLVGTNRWPLAARLASGFLALGCRVAAVGPVPSHPITKVRGFERLYRYDGRRHLESLRAGIEDFAPDLIVPLCDRSVQHLHELHKACNLVNDKSCQVRSLIERSLGAPVSFPIVSSRYDLLMLAKEAGIRVPLTVGVDSAEGLRKWKSSPPWMLKANGTWGGRGVRRADTLASGEEALRELTSKTNAFQLAKQLLLNRDRDWVISSSNSVRPGIIAQAIVPGRPANCSVVCWQGELLAGIAVEVVEADGPWHPAIVVQIVEGSEMLNAAKKIARQLQLTGFFGLDFMIEDGTDDLYLIEMNPRCTPPCSLNLGGERDLLAAIWAKLTRQEMPRREAATRKTRIAYFPQAMQRKVDLADSTYLDIPDDEPELVQELLNPWPERSLLGRFVDHIRSKPSARQAFEPCVFEVTSFQGGGRVRRQELA